MSKEKKNLLIVISSIFNFVMILILTFFYVKLQKKTNDLKKNIDKIPKEWPTENENISIENEVYEKKQQILEKLEQDLNKQEEFFAEFFLDQDKTEIQKKLEDIKERIPTLKKIFKQNEQDKKTKDTFEKSKTYFEDIFSGALSASDKNNFKQLVNYIRTFLKMCEIRDENISAKENKIVSNIQVDETIRILRKYLNGYAFLLDIYLNKFKQIKDLSESLSSRIEKEKLIELQKILNEEYIKFLLELITKTSRSGKIITKTLEEVGKRT
jgi:biopolymer transport protein ExbB/TolQ